MVFIPVASFSPDQPDFQNSGSGVITNVLPRTASSYGPFPGLTVASGALANRCQGAYSMQDSSGNVRLFFGDSGALYRMDPSAATPADVTRLAGGAYATGNTERWAMCLFGQRIIATNFADFIQSYIEGSSTNFATMITSGQTDLKARYVAVVKDWPVFGNTTDGTNGAQPQRVWWPGIDDPTNFPTPGTSAAAAVQSDFQDLVGDFGWVQGIAGNLGTSDGAVFQERGIWRMQYIGPPAIFSFTIAEGARGTPAPGSIVQLSNIAYYLGEDGFYAFDGSQSQPIGFQRVDKTLFGELDQSYFHRVTSTVDPINKIIYWAVPVSGHTGGNPNKIYAYHTALDRWSVTAVNDIQIEVLMRALSFGYTLEQLDALPGWSSGIDSGPVSLDSRTLTGGRSLLACVDTNHKLNTFTGANLAAVVDTSEVQPIPNSRAMITMARPIVDGGAPSVAIATRNRIVDTATYGTAVAMDANGFCPLRSEGRYLRGRITIPAGSSFVHIQGLDIPDDAVVATGAR